MSEETDEEERRLLRDAGITDTGLGEIPEGHRDPGQDYWNPEPDPLSGEAIDLIAQQTVRPSVVGRPGAEFDQLQAEQDTIQVGAEVTSVYAARPINGFDTLIGGTIELSVNVTECLTVSTKPVAPFDESTDLFEDSFVTFINQTFDGCNIKTYEIIPDPDGEMVFEISSPSATATELFNYYLFDVAPGNLLIGIKEDTLIDLTPAEEIDELNVASTQGDAYVLVIQGATSNDVSPGDVTVTARLFSPG